MQARPAAPRDAVVRDAEAAAVSAASGSSRFPRRWPPLYCGRNRMGARINGRWRCVRQLPDAIARRGSYRTVACNGLGAARTLFTRACSLQRGTQHCFSYFHGATRN
ncbi:hypothetical protein MRX96_007038 [Rhipicephalus microplus]